MKKNKFKERGISLISLAITVTVLLIISTTLLYNSKNVFEQRNLKNMYNDIEVLKDKIDIYYVKNEKLPVLNEYENTDADWITDDDKYYIIDLKQLDRITLIYGKDYEKASDQNGIFEDFYIINEKTHQIYYVKGISVKGKIYHTN